MIFNCFFVNFYVRLEKTNKIYQNYRIKILNIEIPVLTLIPKYRYILQVYESTREKMFFNNQTKHYNITSSSWITQFNFKSVQNS